MYDILPRLDRKGVFMEVWTIIAIILGPILAVQVQKLIERLTREREDKKRILVTLLSTRGRTTDREHVQALNLIDFYFSGKNSKDLRVVEAWDEYRAHLNDYPEAPEPEEGEVVSESDHAVYQASCDKWVDDRDTLFGELLINIYDT